MYILFTSSHDSSGMPKKYLNLANIQPPVTVQGEILKKALNDTGIFRPGYEEYMKTGK